MGALLFLEQGGGYFGSGLQAVSHDLLSHVVRDPKLLRVNEV